MTTEAEYLAALQARWGDRASQIAALYPVANFASPQVALERAFGDDALVCDTYDSARRAAAGRASVHLYNFARPIPLPQLAPRMLGATHGAEIAYVFGSVEPTDEADRTIGLTMQGYWTDFAHTGGSEGEESRSWPSYDDGGDERINFDDHDQHRGALSPHRVRVLVGRLRFAVRVKPGQAAGSAAVAADRQ